MDNKISNMVSIFIKNLNTNENIVDTLEEILSLLNNYHTFPKNLTIISNLEIYRHEFEDNFYYDMLSLILNKYLNWNDNNMTRISISENIKKIILNGPPDDTFLCLSSAIIHQEESIIKMTLIKHMQDLLENNCIEKILNKYCLLSTYSTNINSISPNDLLNIEEFNKINQLIVSFPDKILMNNLSIDVTFFYRGKYYNNIGCNIVNSLQKIYSNLKCNKDCSVIPISNLICKINSTGNSEILWNHLIINLSKFYKVDFLWSRIIQKVIYNIDDLSINGILNKIIQTVPDYSHLNCIIGCLANVKKSMILCFQKIVLHNYNENNSKKLLLYISAEEKLLAIYKDLFVKMLELWSDDKSLMRRRVEHSLYICKMIILSISINKKINLDYKEQKDAITTHFLNGIPNYLSSLNRDIQEMGMFVAEYLSIYIEDGKTNLNFEIKKTIISEELNSILVISDEHKGSIIEDINNYKNEVADQLINNENKLSTSNDILDSDDELSAYPSATHVKIEKPKYIYDCVNYLMKSEDPNYVKECLLAIPELVEGRPEASEICVELCRIILHLEDKFGLEDFIQIRFNAMVALALNFPILIANYLTQQFCYPEFSIRHRLDILDIISHSAIKLSSIKKEKSTDCDSALIPLLCVHG